MGLNAWSDHYPSVSSPSETSFQQPSLSSNEGGAIRISSSSSSFCFLVVTPCSQTSIEGTCFINNECYYLFKNRNSFLVTVSNCTIDSGFKTSGSVTVQNNPATSFINRIKCYETDMSKLNLKNRKTLFKHFKGALSWSARRGWYVRKWKMLLLPRST